MSYVTVIGAAVMDISAKSKAPIKPGDSNPGCILRSAGGVGRNIAENLARLSVDVKLIAALGDDAAGGKLLDASQAAGIDMAYCVIDRGAATSTYIAILDANGDMNVAVMEYSAKLTMEHIQKHRDMIAGSEIILLDANLDPEMNAGILDQFPGKAMYIDPISKTKAEWMKHLVGRFHTMKMNQFEASTLAGFAVTKDRESLEKAGDYFLKQGLQRAIISLGEGGLYYHTAEEKILRPARPVSIQNATGAGDAVMAAVIYCSRMGKSADYTVDFAQAMARLTLLSDGAVSSQISIAAVERCMKGQ